jgi:hypothetical protein
MRPIRGRHAAAAAVLVLVTLIGAGVSAQRGGFYREGSIAPRFAPEQMPSAKFIFCRMSYRSVRSEASGIGWRTDYPYAEINLMTRLSELTKTSVSKDDDREANHFVVRLTDDQLFNCPFLMGSDVGTMGLDQDEVERLRLYLLKGGFLWVDDFWGTPAWNQWTDEISRVLPPSEYPIEDVALDDPMLHSVIDLKVIPQITNINFWRRSGGTSTQERGEDSPHADLRVIRDKHHRPMVLMTHNTDLGDSWEREGEDPAFFLQFSPNGYALGMDVLVYTMTH